MKRLISSLHLRTCFWTGALIVAAAHTSLAWATTPPFVTFKRFAPGARVSALASDHDRFFWFGTENGMVRWDGYSMQPLHGPDITPTQILATLVDHTGTLWFGTHGRHPLQRLSHGARAATSVPLEESITDVLVLVEHQGEIWMGTNDGLFRLRGEHTERVVANGLPAGQVHCKRCTSPRLRDPEMHA